MCEAGRILHHLKHNIEDARGTILIVGYQAPDTLGRRLVERRPEVRILGRSFRSRRRWWCSTACPATRTTASLLRSLGPLAGDDAAGAAGARRAGAGGGAGRGAAVGGVRRRRHSCRTATRFLCSEV